MKTVLNDNKIIYYPSGIIGNVDAGKFEQDLLKIIGEHGDSDLIINMEDVPSIGSSVISVLISLTEKLKNRDRLLSICNPQDLVMKIISMLHIDDYISVYQTENQAVKSDLR